MQDNRAPAMTNDDAHSVKRQRQTPEQRVAKLRAQLARATAQQQRRSRQMETREKIVIGSAVMKAMRDNEAFRWQVTAILQADVTREIDREAIASWLAPISIPR